MNEKRIVKELPPIRTIKNDNGYTIKVWNREYKIEDTPLFSSIISAGCELLASPIRIVGEEAGGEIVWEDGKTFKMEDATETYADFCQSFHCKNFILNTHIHAEYDGFMDISFSLVPMGYTVPQTLGLEELPDLDMTLSKLWIEIPLKADCVKYYQHAWDGGTLLDGKTPDIDPSIAQAGAFPEKSVEIPFKQQFYLGNDKVGISTNFYSDKNFKPKDETRVMGAYKENGAVVMRFCLLDDEPDIWKHAKKKYKTDILPLTYQFGMQIAPVKPFPENPHTEKNMHIDCFKKIPNDYEEFLFEPYDETGELVIDRLKRLGVGTLYLHEKWNDLQNSVFLTEKTANRLRLIVKEAHKRKMKVIPYFGYEISSLAPYFHEKAEEYRNKTTEELYHPGQWFRFPCQRDPNVCYNSEYADIFAKGIERLLDEFGFDGIYLDSTVNPRECINEAHGCGYRDINGNIHPTWSTKANRSLLKKLYEIVDKRGGIINLHAGTLPLYTLAFTHSMWDGEIIQHPLLHGKISSVPEGHFLAMYQGRNIGIPVNMLCYSNPPVWTFGQGLATSLPIGVLPKPVDVGEPLEEMSVLWNIVDSFPISKSKWMPFYENGVKTDNENVKVSYYQAKNKYLIFMANWDNTPTGKVKVNLPKEITKIKNEITKEELKIASGALEIEFEKMDYLVLKGEK